MMSDVSLRDQDEIDFLLYEIALRPYPHVFVVEEDTEEARDIWELQHDCEITEQRKKEIANENGILLLDGFEVLKHLRGEMDPARE